MNSPDAIEAALLTRRSVRGFLPRPVPRALIERLLTLAARAPSGTNVQPWRVHVLQGDALRRLGEALVAAHDADPQPSAPDYRYYPAQWRDPYLARRRKVGWDLYGLLGIAKGDQEAAHRQHGRNYTFFGAPVGLILTFDRDLSQGAFVESGMFLQALMTAARAHGLDTCPQAAFIEYAPIIRAQLGLGDDQLVVCGMALGYADPDEPANRLVTEREPVASFATFLDV